MDHYYHINRKKFIPPVWTQLAIITALASVILLGHGGRKALADCSSIGVDTFLCSGVTNVTQSLTGTALTVTTSSGFEINTSSGDALYLESSDGMSFTDSFASPITGFENGAAVGNLSTGDLFFTATGTITGLGGIGLVAVNSIVGNNLTINAASVVGHDYGMLILNQGMGTVWVEASGTVTGNNNSGIDATNNGTDLMIDATSVQALGANLSTGGNGIKAENNGSGDLSITATGHIEAIMLNGIFAENYGKDLMIEAASINAGTNGIKAENSGSGALSITTTGSIITTGSIVGDEAGILAVNHGTNLIIEAASIDALIDGINAENNGSGALSITTTESVAGDEVGILAVNHGTNLTIGTAGVSGGTDGISAQNFGTGILSITTNGRVVGDSGAGIVTETDMGMLTNITLNGGAEVSSQTDAAIRNNHGDSSILARAGSIINRDVILGDGSDELTFDGGMFHDSPTFDGGDDYSSADGFVDRLTFRDVSGSATGINWEQIFVANSVVTLSGSGSDFTSPEVLSLTDGGDLTIDGNFIGTGGQLLMGVDPANFDTPMLTITGTSSGTTTISLNNGGRSPVVTGDDIALITVQGGIGSANDFVLDGSVPLGAFLFDLGTDGNDFFLTSTTLSPETSVFEAYPQILLGLNGLSNFGERFGERLYAAQDNGTLSPALMGYAPSVDLSSNSVPPRRNNFVWARIEGAYRHLDPTQSSTMADYDINQGKIRAGMDAQLAEADTGLLLVGLNASYGKAFADIAAAIGSGTIESTGTSVAASLTWLGSAGFYADAQAQYSWFSSDLASDTLGALESGNDGDGHTLSLEIGRRFETTTGHTVTPQAQLVYSAVDFEDFSSAYGTLVVADETDSLKLRTGVAIERGFSVMDETGQGGYGTISTIANVYHEFREGTSVAVSGIPLNTETDAWSGEIGLGASFASADGIYAIHGNANVSTGLEDFAESFAVTGAANMTINF